MIGSDRADPPVPPTAPIRWRAWTRLLALKGLTTFYRRVVWVARPVDRAIPEPAVRLPVAVAPLTTRDLDAYRRFRPDQSTDAVRARLARGDVCLATWHAGRIIQGMWVSTGRAHLPYLRCDLLLPSGTAYVQDVYTLPAYRGRGLASSAAAHRLRSYRERGFRQFVAMVALENRAGLRLVEKTGYRPIGRSACLRLGPWQRDWHTIRADQSLRIVSSRRSSAGAGG
jgi:GNAT superfamily N-acetyltransferase